MEEALSEAGPRLRCAEDLGGEGRKRSGEGKPGEVKLEEIGGQEGYLRVSICMGEKALLTAPPIPLHSVGPRLSFCHGVGKPVKPTKYWRKKNSCFLPRRVALSQFLVGLLQDLS